MLCIFNLINIDALIKVISIDFIVALLKYAVHFPISYRWLHVIAFKKKMIPVIGIVYGMQIHK